jgi:hypothetical protein
MAIYKNTSPYSETDYSKGYLDVITFRSVPESVGDIVYTIPKEYENRPDLLAYKLYGDVDLWWVFSVRNSNIIRDPVFDMVAGITIYLPTQDTLKSILGK